jgi:RimJ/RimL family protein N-acetyltransferase
MGMGISDLSPQDELQQVQDAWTKGRSAVFAICDTGSEACRGVVILELREAGRADAGYWVLPEARGRGLASHGLRLLAEWALRALPLGRVQLWTHPDNIASQRVATRAGFVREGVLRAYGEERNGRRADAIFFSLVHTDLG